MTNNNRLEELKTIGYRNLSMEEREEYSRLKDETKTEEVKPKEKEDEMITLSKKQLKAMIAEIQADSLRPDLRDSKDWREVEEGRPIKTARMKLYQEDSNAPKGLIIDWKFFKNEYDENTRKYDKAVYELTVKYDSGEKKIKLPYLDFIKINDYETVIILETTAKKLEKIEGKIRRAMPDRSGYTRSAFPGAGGSVDNPLFGDWVDQKVERIESFHKIKRPNGEILEINNTRLNA